MPLRTARRMYHARRLRRLRGVSGLVGAWLFLQGVVFLMAGDTFAVGKGYSWMASITPDESVWAGIWMGLGVVIWMTPFLPYIRFRLLVSATNGVLLAGLAVQFYRASPNGAGWVFYLVPAIWMWGRVFTLVGHWLQWARRGWEV